MQFSLPITYTSLISAVTAVTLLALKYTIGLRPEGKGEGQGLDLHIHGQEAYEQYARDLMKQNAPTLTKSDSVDLFAL